jgi:hypothetical protein
VANVAVAETAASAVRCYGTRMARIVAAEDALDQNRANPKGLNRWSKRRWFLLVMIGVISVGLFRTRGRGFSATDGNVPTLPTFTSEALDGRKWTFPKDLSTTHTLIALAFTQNQQDDVDTWVPVVDELLASRGDLAFFEFPTLNNRGYYDNPIFRKTLASGMRSGIPSKIARARTITTYVRVDEFIDAMGLKGTSEIHVLLVDKQGRVKWSNRGPRTDSAVEELTSALR